MGLKDRLVSKRLAAMAQGLVRQKKFVTLKTAKTAGILRHADDEAAFEQLKRVLNEQNIRWRELCLVNAKKSESENEIAKKDFSFLGSPRKESVNGFTREPFDLLIDISLSKGAAAQYIRAMSVARFKVGWSDAQPDFFDLRIDVSHQPDAAFLVQQITHYLSEINKDAIA